MDDTAPAAAPAPEGGDQYRTLIEEMGKLYERMRALVEKANRQGEMSSDEEEELARMQKKYDSMRSLKERNVTLMRMAAEHRESAPAPTVNVGVARQSQKTSHFAQTNEYRDAFMAYLKGPRFVGDLERRALSEGTDADGGYLPSQDFYSTLVKVLEQQVIYRRIANVMSLGAFKTNIALESSIATASWGAEAAAISETTPQFGQLVLQPRRLSAIVKSSVELIEDAPARGPGFSVESIVADQLGRAFALAEENAFSTGVAASNQPVGIFTYTSSGISDGKTCASTSAITANELLDFVYSLPRQYREQKSTCIVTSDAVLALIRKLASPGTNTFLSYLWQPSFQQGEPDRLSGIPIYATQYAPSIAAGARVAVIGDFSRYHIGVRSGMSVKVLRELYAGNGQIGFQAIARLDAGCSIYNAFRYLRMAVS
jgi:HK97 family phage major capsid protein